MKRHTALVAMRTAGYHNDTRSFTRLLVENRISKAKANEEWQRGIDMRKARVACTCPECLTLESGE